MYLVIYYPHCTWGSRGESLVFSPTPSMASCCFCCTCLTEILSESTGLLHGSVPALLEKRDRGGQGGYWSQGLSATVAIFRGIAHFGLQSCRSEEYWNNGILFCGSVLQSRPHVHTQTHYRFLRISIRVTLPFGLM